MNSLSLFPPSSVCVAPREPPSRLQESLLAWFAGARRALPWRDGYGPYAVWIAEMMLQQTQVETVKPYFARWMARFPDVRTLAEAPLDAVLKAWEGLGYYARARNLHRAAREIVARHGGSLPADYASLLALPGIGDYTAGAIASIAFNLPLAAVDSNVARVLSRLFALAESPGAAGGKARLRRLAESLIPVGRARDFNQGLMELGALICRARRPLCGLCPVRAACAAFREGEPERYPARVARPERRPVRAVMAILHWRGRLLLRQRPPKGLWGGLWEFPWEELGSERSAEELYRGLAIAAGAALQGPPRTLGPVRHGLTHREFSWTCLYGRSARAMGHAMIAEGDGFAFRWTWPDALAKLALSRPARKAWALIGEASGVPREELARAESAGRKTRNPGESVS